MTPTTSKTTTATSNTPTLTIIDISSDFSKSTPKGIRSKIESALANAECISLDTTKLKSHNLKNARSEFQKSIFRFVKDQDKLLQLCSLLLKSRAYHIIHQTTNNADPSNQKKNVSPPETKPPPRTMTDLNTIVQLPRTQYGKPYIPTSTVDFNISHQFPYAAILRSNHPRQSVGLDVVVMRPNTDSAAEFLQYFEDSFAPSEWNRILRLPKESQRICEFFVRWSMKEAYTKALGKGMQFEFKSFEILLRNDSDCDSLWEDICSAGGTKHQVKWRADVVFYENVGLDEPQELRGRVWDFVFMPLEGYECAASLICACVECIEEEEEDGHRWELDLEWMTFTELIHWHAPQDTI